MVFDITPFLGSVMIQLWVQDQLQQQERQFIPQTLLFNFPQKIRLTRILEKL